MFVSGIAFVNNFQFRRFVFSNLLSFANIYCENMTKGVLQIFAFPIGGNFNGLWVVGDYNVVDVTFNIKFYPKQFPRSITLSILFLVTIIVDWLPAPGFNA